ncbi:MAG: type II toxin-antitoxin system VapC family toxin, partial [Pyrinomonadaceae bacterium]
MIVVDSNVIAYLLIPGDTTQIAEKVWGKDSTWAAPRLWRSELRNVLGLYMRQQKMDLDKAQLQMGRAEQLMNGREYDVASGNVLEIAQSSGCTAYDCEFVYLAEQLDVPFVTSDKKLLTAFPATALSMA